MVQRMNTLEKVVTRKRQRNWVKKRERRRERWVRTIKHRHPALMMLITSGLIGRAIDSSLGDVCSDAREFQEPRDREREADKHSKEVYGRDGVCDRWAGAELPSLGCEFDHMTSCRDCGNSCTCGGTRVEAVDYI
ncbi:hypothetical protein RRG08_049060 [Elysia crispata]|uniref:Uncharacterized protein n=1 Tax=Elysia crispata TaxID=231223 RepID=A0AAE1AAF7_9GAST|nr:hypothetical protein RRG08_049060 [Elysia crispata]